jgi:hypothetical protein
MCNIVIKEILTNRSLPDAGSLLYDNIVCAIDTDDKLQIDMTDVSSLPSVFLNASLGRAIDGYGKDFVKKYVCFLHITKSQAQRLSDYMSRY